MFLVGLSSSGRLVRRVMQKTTVMFYSPPCGEECDYVYFLCDTEVKETQKGGRLSMLHIQRLPSHALGFHSYFQTPRRKYKSGARSVFLHIRGAEVLADHH